MYHHHTPTNSHWQANHTCTTITHRYTFHGEQSTRVSTSDTNTLTHLHPAFIFPLPLPTVSDADAVSSQRVPQRDSANQKHEFWGFSQPETLIFGIQPTRNIHFWDSANQKCSFLGFSQPETFILGIQPTTNVHFGDSANQKRSFWGFSQPETYIFFTFAPPWFACQKRSTMPYVLQAD